MADPWLTLIGIGEDGLDGLPPASRKALDAAEIVFGGPRHLALAKVGSRGHAWPVPFSVAPVLACRGQDVVVIASGDPFWHGAGGSLMAHLAPDEWRSLPAPSTFSLVANRLGWRLEDISCHGLHAAPFAQLLPHLGRACRLVCTLRDGATVTDLAAWLVANGAPTATLHVLERLGGPMERVRSVTAHTYDLTDVQTPVVVAIELANSAGLARTPGLADDQFHTDGQITKQPIRALTLCALAPRNNDLLWDIGAGSGSISVEWCLQGGRAIAVEARPGRMDNIAANIARFGLSDRMQVVNATVSNGLLPPELTATCPDAVFVGGGADAALLSTLFASLPPGVRLVVNAVTLETEMLVLDWHAKKGGDLIRIDIARVGPLGGLRGWLPSRPVVQWSIRT